MLEKIFHLLTTLSKSFFSFLKVLIRSKFLLSLPKEEATAPCIILANGPSLKAVVSKYSKELQHKKTWVVNSFVHSEYYEVIQPKYYLLIDPVFWQEGVPQRKIDARKKLLDEVTQKTTWPMTFFVPVEAFRSKFLQAYLNKNPKVTFLPFNKTPLEGFQWFKHLFFNWRLGMPRPHNVLIPCILTALQMGFKEIYLFGAEHSWLPLITVNDYNEVYMTQKHFYDKGQVKQDRVYTAGVTPKRLHHLLNHFVIVFQEYFTLRDYATSQGAHVYNATPDSYIDAFDRKKAEEVL